jgi:hypothetical protein
MTQRDVEIVVLGLFVVIPVIVLVFTVVVA